jgi:hypothetical protein
MDIDKPIKNGCWNCYHNPPRGWTKSGKKKKACPGCTIYERNWRKKDD